MSSDPKITIERFRKNAFNERMIVTIPDGATEQEVATVIRESNQRNGERPLSIDIYDSNHRPVSWENKWRYEAPDP